MQHKTGTLKMHDLKMTDKENWGLENDGLENGRRKATCWSTRA